MTRRKQRGGKRRLSRKAGQWSKFVGKIYREMKAKNPKVSLKDAMKAASRRKSEM
jgi:hypothetical protein